MHYWVLISAALAGIGLAMAVLFSEDVQLTGTNQSVLLNTETIIQQGIPSVIPTDTVKIAVLGTVNFTGQAGFATVTLRIRRGTSLTGSIVGSSIFDGSGLSSPGVGTTIVTATEVLSNTTFAQYVMTAQPTGGAVQINTASLNTKVLSG